jgi:hypothetical protein
MARPLTLKQTPASGCVSAATDRGCVETFDLVILISVRFGGRDGAIRRGLGAASDVPSS